VQTNVGGAQNIVQVVRQQRLPVECVVGISTDKACQPVNVMGMTKAIQERILIRANYDLPETRFVCVRYGNVLASRGSVIPLFHAQIRQGGPVTITTPEMTRFLLTLDQAADAVFAALQAANRGEVFVPQAPGARIVDLAEVLIGGRPIGMQVIGIRPGEKVHETLISEEEGHRTSVRGMFYAIAPILPELRLPLHEPPLGRAYTSADYLLSPPELYELLSRLGLLVDAQAPFAEAWI
jgi:UDP-glucose 4-epimerase